MVDNKIKIQNRILVHEILGYGNTIKRLFVKKILRLVECLFLVAGVGELKFW